MPPRKKRSTETLPPDPPSKRLTKVQQWDILEELEEKSATRRPVEHVVGDIAHRYQVSHAVIWKLIRRYRDTSPIAAIYFRSQSLRMARAVVEKGTVQDYLDVLTRPNVGALKPLNKGGESQPGIFISVNAETCGAYVGTRQQGVLNGQSHVLQESSGGLGAGAQAGAPETQTPRD